MRRQAAIASGDDCLPPAEAFGAQPAAAAWAPPVPQRSAGQAWQRPVVAVPALAPLTELDLDEEAAGRLGCAPGPLCLTRAWPREAGLIAVELRDAAGDVVGGQCHAQQRALRRAARATAATGRGACTVVEARGTAVLLQTGGADRRLPGLGAALGRPGAVLVAHRAEQRAVVRVGGPVPAFVKAVRPRAVPRVAGAAGAAAGVARTAGHAFSVAAPRAVDSALGLLETPVLHGAALSQCLAGSDRDIAADAAGRAIAALHAVPGPPGAPAHGPAEELAVLRRWLDRLAPHAPALAARLATLLPAVARRLTDVAQPFTAALHRDLHDGQLLVDGAGRVALLDVDTLAVGEPALDVANLMVHLELAAAQGRCTPPAARSAAAAFLAAYDPPPSLLARLPAYADATRLRLACVHAFRPAPPDLLDRLTAALDAV